MALKSLITGKKGEIGLNSLKRWTLSAIIVPSQELSVANVPPAVSATSPGRSPLIPLQGPADASTEVYSLTGKQGVVNQGIGTVTTDGIAATVTGVGTKFTKQLQVGDTIRLSDTISGTILTISSDTVLTTTVALGAAAASNYFFSIAALANLANLGVVIEDTAWRRKWMNRDVPANHVFGSNTKPVFIKESALLETDQTLLMQFTNYTVGTAASFAPIAEGRKWQYEALKTRDVYEYIAELRERKMYLEPFWLTLDDYVINLGVAGSSTAGGLKFLTCTGDITLVLFNVYGYAIAADNTAYENNVLLALQDPKTMRAMQVQPMPMSCCTGTAENPFRIQPWVVEPQTQIQANFQNLGNQACKAYLTLHGVAIYTGSSFHGSTLTNKKLIEEAAKMYEAMSIPQLIPASPQ